MLVVHPRGVTPEIILLGKITGIEGIALRRVPIKIEGPGFVSDLVGAGRPVPLVHAILFVMNTAVLSYSFLTAAKCRCRIHRHVVMKTLNSQKQRDLLSEVYLHHGMAR